MSSSERIVIVGAGQAASELAASLRKNGWGGQVTVVGDEPYLPYQRPPLSKAFLNGEITEASLLLKPHKAWAEAAVEIRTGTRVEAIDRVARRVLLSGGEALDYGQLALTVGGRPRALQADGMEAAGRARNFHYLRTITDVHRIQEQIKPGASLVVIGGGYVGLEVAAVAIGRSMRVTVLEAAPRVLARVTVPAISDFYERAHREAGVNVRTGVMVTAVETDEATGLVTAVVCNDGTRIEADAVIVGVGLLPNVELADAAGLAVDNGIVVDEYARTSDESIVAAGDCTNHPSASTGTRLRLESVPNAIEQARTAAATLCGKQVPYRAVPWFWSDQYDLKLKSVGLSLGHDQIVLRGSTEKRAFAAFYLKGDRVVGADTISRPQEFMIARRLVAERISVDPALLADDTVNLKTLLPAA